MNNVGQQNTSNTSTSGVHLERYLRTNGTRLQLTASFTYKYLSTVRTATLHRQIITYLQPVTDLQWSLDNSQPGNPEPLVVRNILGQLYPSISH